MDLTGESRELWWHRNHPDLWGNNLRLPHPANHTHYFSSNYWVMEVFFFFFSSFFSTFSLSPLVRRQEVRLDGIGEVIRVGVEIDEGV